MDLLNGISYLYPAVPSLKVFGINLREYITAHPWDACSSPGR